MEKVAVIGVMSVLLAIPLKSKRPDIALTLIISACLLIVGLALYKIKDIFHFLESLEHFMGKGSVYIKILMKMLGITYFAEFSSNLCKDAGYSAVANQIEFYGKIMLLALSIPILQTLMETLRQF